MAQGVPEFRIGDMPTWFNIHGSGMWQCQENVPGNQLVIAGHAAKVIIEKEGQAYRVFWEITHHGGSIVGNIFMFRPTLEAAFGLTDSIQFADSEWLIDEYGATTAAYRAFIRFGDYLNMPGPGTGHDGDPNISIKIDNGIRQAVGALVG